MFVKIIFEEGGFAFCSAGLAQNNTVGASVHLTAQ